MTYESAIDEFLQRHRLVVCVGPGGVGKTTTAAALALRGAAQGRRALVLTIDPARRLADALGLDGLDDSLRQVPGVDGGSLHAAMLDTKASFDALIARIAEPDAAARILDNRVYRAFSRTLARSHAYVAAERLYDVLAGDEFDLVVLDTPPTRSALEILDAPLRLAQFLDEDVLKYFLRRDESKVSLAGLARLGGRAALRLLGVLVGEEVVDELLGFFTVLADQREGFVRRAEATAARLRDPATGYALVASTSPASLADAAHLADGLRAREMAPSLMVFNRAFVAEPETTTPVRPPSGPRPDDALRGRVWDLRAALSTAARAALSRAKEVAGGVAAVALADREVDPQSLEELLAMLRSPVAIQ